MNIQVVFAFCDTVNVKGIAEHAFGYKDGLPWGYLPQDMKNFAERTKNTMLVMGAKTFMSLPSLLPNRPHLVVIKRGKSLPLNRKGQTADYYIFEDEYEGFLKTGKCGGLANFNSFSYVKNILFHKGYENISIIGGKSLIESGIDVADKIIMSIITKKHYVVSDVKINKLNIYLKLATHFKLSEKKNWYMLDELTSLEENVFVRENNERL